MWLATLVNEKFKPSTTVQHSRQLSKFHSNMINRISKEIEGTPEFFSTVEIINSMNIYDTGIKQYYAELDLDMVLSQYEISRIDSVSDNSVIFYDDTSDMYQNSIYIVKSNLQDGWDLMETHHTIVFVPFTSNLSEDEIYVCYWPKTLRHDFVNKTQDIETFISHIKSEVQNRNIRDVRLFDGVTKLVESELL